MSDASSNTWLGARIDRDVILSELHAGRGD
jgi:hypothetical protein